MKPVKLVLMATAILCLTFVVTAQGPQNGQPQQGQPQADPDRIEAAHSELLNAKDKAAEASKLTEAVAPALPGAAASTAPIPRKNFIDEHIFGRIERDNIPHAPLASDEEFLRRAYVDAVGFLPTRSEEHTSELQSLRHLVCRLLLEKKKKKNKAHTTRQGQTNIESNRHDKL